MIFLMRFLLSFLLVVCNFLQAEHSLAERLPQAEFNPLEVFSGGEATGHRQTAGAFSEASSNLSFSQKGLFLVGNDFFEDPWVIAPSSTTIRDGLGPLFNVSACQSCHINDGRGHAPSENARNTGSLLFRTSTLKVSDEQKSQMQKGLLANVGDTFAGRQIQDRAIPSVQPEATIQLEYQYSTVRFDDGFELELRKPQWTFKAIGGKFDQDTIFSPRVATPMIGLGLLEAIDEADILSQEDLADKNNDGISGKANRVWNKESGRVSLGRFGWKAGQPSVIQQNAAAFHGDLGLTSRLFPDENCLSNQTDCLSQPTGKGKGEDYEIRDDVLDFVVFYSKNLAVPKRRSAQNTLVLQGKALFIKAGCAACHMPSYVTTKADNMALSGQTIWPYTDLLLHDMGEDLADINRQNVAQEGVPVEFQATAREWRTPPLWGIGLTHIVDSRATFLHDGRARNLMEAVLWHGGEAEQSKQRVLQFDAVKRDALMAFLNSL